MKRRELKNMVMKKREYVAVPAKTARCDTSLLCPSDAAPTLWANTASLMDAMCDQDMDMFAVPRVRMYGVLFRISKSAYANSFTLKGGILLYGLYSDNFTRATTDIDLLGGNI